MNNRTWFFVPLLLFALTLTLYAQPASHVTPPGASHAQPAAAGAASTASSAFPDEKSLIIGGGSATGAEVAGTTNIKPVKSVGVWDFVQMILVLALVVAGIYLLFYFLKRAGGPKSQDNELISVLSSRALQPNRALHLVDVGGSLYLVGTSESSVNLVAAIQDKESVDEIRLRASQAGPLAAHKSFRDVFSGVFQKNTGGFGFGGSVMQSMGFLKQQRERLRKM